MGNPYGVDTLNERLAIWEFFYGDHMRALPYCSHMVLRILLHYENVRAYGGHRGESHMVNRSHKVSRPYGTRKSTASLSISLAFRARRLMYLWFRIVWYLKWRVLMRLRSFRVWDDGNLHEKEQQLVKSLFNPKRTNNLRKNHFKTHPKTLNHLLSRRIFVIHVGTWAKEWEKKRREKIVGQPAP